MPATRTLPSPPAPVAVVVAGDGERTVVPVSPTATDILDACVTAAGGRRRDGQRRFAEVAGNILTDDGHLVAEAPTGVGKTFAYLSAAAATLAAAPAGDDRRTIIVTSTKSLQDQLVRSDLPRVLDAAAELGVHLSGACVKGRSNYPCPAVIADGRDRIRNRPSGPELLAWVDGGGVDLDELEDLPAATVNAARVAPGACPGASSCAYGAVCPSEQARRDAADADIVVVNTALYCTWLAAEGGSAVPPHRWVIVDEAHELPAIATDAFSATVNARTVTAVCRRAEQVLVGDRANTAIDQLAGAAATIETFDDHVDATAVRHVAEQIAFAATTVQNLLTHVEEPEAGRVSVELGRIVDAAARIADPAEGTVVYRPGPGVVTAAPVDIGGHLARSFWSQVSAVATSATLGNLDTWRVAAGAPSSTTTGKVPSPFDHATAGLLYVPDRFPLPKDPGWLDAVTAMVAELAGAAGGRTLSLHTSTRAARTVADQLAARHPALRVLCQGDLGRNQLLEELRSGAVDVLCATRSFWAGVDVPGDALQVVVVDKLPFPPPHDALLTARRELAESRGQMPFMAVDVPEAARQLAQGAGRLIRTEADRGVVAVCDPRLATARYRDRLLEVLPPFRRTRTHSDVVSFLQGLR